MILVAGIALLAGLALLGAFSAPPRSAEPQTATAQVASTQGGAGEQTLEISEAELSNMLNQRLAGRTLGTTPLGPATLQSITAHLSSDQLRAEGDALVGSATVPVTMTAGMRAESGRVVVNVEDLRAAGVPLPTGARSSIQSAVQTQVDAEVQRLQLRVSSVSIADGKLRLSGTR